MARNPSISLSSFDRYCIVGKTRSGKTFATVLLVALLLPWRYPPPEAQRRRPWQVWWVDTKGDPKDLRRLKEWGFRDAATAPRDWPRLIFRVRPVDEADELSVAKQVQRLCFRATRRGRVLVVLDEYVSCVMNDRSSGPGIKEVAQRGGGLKVGLIGGTQEPKGVPRPLKTMATHTFLFNVTYNYDIEWCNEMCPQYGDGPPDKHGFWYRWLDGPKDVSRWMYFSDITEFVACFPNQLIIPTTPADEGVKTA